eukprot:s768_g18.t1
MVTEFPSGLLTCSHFKVKTEYMTTGELNGPSMLTSFESGTAPSSRNMLTSFETISRKGNETLRTPGTSQNITSMAMTSGEFTGDESPNSKRRTAHALASGGMSDFIKVSRRNSWNDEKSERRRKAMRIISSPYVADFMVMVVMVDSYSTCADIDARALGNRVDPWLSTLSKVCLVLYTVEMVLLLSLKGFNLLRKDRIGLGHYRTLRDITGMMVYVVYVRAIVPK